MKLEGVQLPMAPNILCGLLNFYSDYKILYILTTKIYAESYQFIILGKNPYCVVQKYVSLVQRREKTKTDL